MGDSDVNKGSFEINGTTYAYKVHTVFGDRYFDTFAITQVGDSTQYEPTGIVDSNGDSALLSKTWTYLQFDRKRPYKTFDNIDGTSQSDREAYSSFYFVDDGGFFTINSPEIEFDSYLRNVDLGVYGIDLVGTVEFNSINARYNIIADAPQFLNTEPHDTEQNVYLRSSKYATGFVNKVYSTVELKKSKGRILSSANIWSDDVCNILTWDGNAYSWNQDQDEYLYTVYPWQRQHLNNYNNNRFEPKSHNGFDNGSKSGITNE